ncbi:MAG: trypsin-like peptidase domain-containing protein [Spirochaetia bacterium]|nr:trypsin-like peptidase domain-containing protein [Spirochaetia bacterium]MCF7940215.1 trypsin-like peptidase domain-containing protein [Spirochaetia bacterium]
MRRFRTYMIPAVMLLSAAMLFMSCSASEPVAKNGDEDVNGVLERVEVPEAQQEVLLPAQKTGPAVAAQPISGTIEPPVLRETTRSTDLHDDYASIESLQNSFNAVVTKVLPTVVEINVTALETRQAMDLQGWPWFFDSDPYEQEYESNRLGSGVIFRKDGTTFYILTNDHVAADANSIEVVLDDGRVYDAQLVGTDSRRDLAIVSFESDETDVPIANLGDSNDLKVGDWVLAMGSPFGYVSSVTAGIVSALGRSGRDINNLNDFIQTDAAINSGNSGGPLVNIYGEVVGINTWIAAPSGGSIGLGFAIPISNAKLIIDELIEFGQAVDGWLGISMLEIEQYESLLKQDEPVDVTGVFVGNVYLDSPAYKGGIRAGDIIIGFNDKMNITIDELSRFISNAPLGVEQVFTLNRAGEEYRARVMLEQRKSDEEISGSSSQLWPGVIPVELDENILRSLGLGAKQHGVMIQMITSSTEVNRFFQAGLANYDVITEINGKEIHTLTDFYTVISHDDTKVFNVNYIREGKTYTTGVKK